MGLVERTKKAVSGRWIAGDSLSDAIDITKKLNKRGITAVLSYMGADLTNRKAIDDATKSSERAIKEISDNKLKAEISIRTTQLGLLENKAFVEAFYDLIITKAKRSNIFVWLDMEREEYVTDIINLYKRNIDSNVTGICLQSYLKRSMSDLEDLVSKGAAIRLVKGDYRGIQNDSEIAYTDNVQVTKNYLDMMEYLFSRSRKRFVIASHDPLIIERAIQLKQNTSIENVEFGMLIGMRNSYAVKLAERGLKVQMYVPYGKEWLGYGLTRLRLMHNTDMVVRSLLENQHI
ncbi:MAG: proline dehydrogenase family protein [Candidatus Micrarchaeota archaeon]|nr:proline dehydrogenase family protein [Candidatus Micrarchaeota archaeon]MDE1859131.1 proline dehydrogenase family protein [Candidatus Micrarchaeota archaeon]